MSLGGWEEGKREGAGNNGDKQGGAFCSSHHPHAHSYYFKLFIFLILFKIYQWKKMLGGASVEEIVCVLKFIILSVVKLDGAYEFDEFKFFNPNK